VSGRRFPSPPGSYSFRFGSVTETGNDPANPKPTFTQTLPGSLGGKPGSVIGS
jgi:hypothetical protein